MSVRFTVRRLFLLTAVFAYALTAYLFIAETSPYASDQSVFVLTPVPNVRQAPGPPPAR